MKKEKLIEIIKEQLAIEYNCLTDDFFKENNIVTNLKYDNRIRHYEKNNDASFFSMVSLGKNVVITSNECLHDWLKEYIINKIGYHIFEYRNLYEIDKELRNYNKKIKGTFHFFLSDKEIEPNEIGIKTKIFEQDEINQFYTRKLFENNALQEKSNLYRPDVLLIVGYDNEKVIGAAGCSADTPLLWQIGIDVDKDYRRRGIGTYLVQLLKKETEKRNKIPFYGTSLSNLYSWNIAIKSGFFPAWIEATST
jgi:GNAT superfamily N-acetyltransferase